MNYTDFSADFRKHNSVSIFYPFLMAKRKPRSIIFPFNGSVSSVFKDTKQYKEGHQKAGQSFDIFTTILQPENPWAEDPLPEIWIQSFGEENRPKDQKTGKVLEKDHSLKNYPLSISARGYARQSDGRIFGEVRIYPAGQDQVFNGDDSSNLGQEV